MWLIIATHEGLQDEEGVNEHGDKTTISVKAPKIAKRLTISCDASKYRFLIICVS